MRNHCLPDAKCASQKTEDPTLWITTQEAPRSKTQEQEQSQG